MERRSAQSPPENAREILISVSPHAGPRSPRERADAISAELTSAGYRVQLTDDLEELSKNAVRLHESGELRCVLACGGDGTAAVVRNRVPLEVPLVLVPMGTENLLGQYVGQSAVPADVRATVDRGVTIGLDLGLADDHRGNRRYFLMMISAGFDAEVVRRVHERRRGHITHGTYLQPMLETIRSYGYPEIRLYCGDETTRPVEPIRSRWLFGFNLPLYARGWQMAPDASGTNGQLDVCTFQGGSVFHGIRYLWHVMRGSHLTLSDTRLVHCNKLRVEAADSGEVAYQIDGDFGGTLPVEVNVLPEQLKLLVMPDVAQKIGFPHMNNPAQVGPHRCGADEPLLVIAGPCVIENESLTLSIAEQLARDTRDVAVQLVFKASFDKANRTSIDAYRGPGLEEGLRILERVRDDVGLPVTTDIHLPPQAAPAGEVCELLQIPAFLARQTDLLVAAAQTGRAVNVKKGQFMAPLDMRNVVDKLSAAGCRDILLCERGTFFGYGRLVNDMRAIGEMQSLGVPVIFDATHSVQEPGGLGRATGGNRRMVEPLARAAMALGAEGLFCETHPDPDRSPSDGANMVPLAQFADMLRRLVEIRATVRQFDPTPTRV